MHKIKKLIAAVLIMTVGMQLFPMEIKEENELPKIVQKQTDTDEDGLSDADELLLGLDPLVPVTDGTNPDSERIFHQVLNDEKISEKLLAEENAAVPSLELNINGNINKKVLMTETASKDFIDSRAVVGEPIDITGKDISDGTLSFVNVRWMVWKQPVCWICVLPQGKFLFW